MKKIRTLLCIVTALVLLCGSASALTLKKGANRVEALFLNLRLQQLGYEVDASSSKYDSATAAAVKSFQESRGLKATGSVNDETWEALFHENFRLGYSMGLGSRDYYVIAGLVSPFTSVEVLDNTYGADYTAKMTADGFDCYVQLTTSESLAALVQEEKDATRKAFDETFATQYDGKNFKISGEKKSKINGKPVQIWSTSWTFTNGEKLNHYSFIGVVELDERNGRQMFAVSSLVYNIPPAAKSLTKSLGINCVTEALSNVRCDLDRLAEYQAGAAKRKKASKLKIKLPDFQPVEEGEQGTLDMLYEIRNYVDPAADGSSGKIDESTCVSLYYGTKIMQRYVYLVEAGNKASDAFFESSMSLANAVFDSSLKADMPAAREKLAAALSAAKLALTKDAAPYLVLLGLDSPRWTAEDLSEMSDQLLGVLDRMIGSAQ